MRRNHWNANYAASFAMMCLRTQLHNARNLDNALVLTYESLVQDPAQTCQQLERFLPQLGTLDHAASFKVHSIDGTLNRPITDLNAKKIAALSADTITTMNKIFVQHRETLEGWGYELLAPG